MKEDYLSTGRKNQKIHTRKKILLSAQHFLVKGIDFTLEDVAREASISRATVYRYYSKVDVLSVEAGLDLNTASPETIIDGLKHLGLQEIILGIQDYFNHLSLENEAAFRKYLGITIANTSSVNKRGARRSQTLKMALAGKKTGLGKTELDKFTHIATVLMGMEALIVTKDVCQLDNDESLRVLKWGLEMMLKGVFADQ